VIFDHRWTSERLSRRFIAPLMLVAIQICTSLPAHAIFGGDSALGDSRIVALVSPRDNPRAACSAGLITNQIVVTAAHCLGNVGKTYVQQEYSPSDLWVAPPGVDLNVLDRNLNVQVLRVIISPGYNNTWDPERGISISQKDDIAFLFLASPLVSSYTIPIATASDVENIKKKRSMITHLGYGNEDVNSADGKPYSVSLQAYATGASRYKTIAVENKTIATQEIGTAALCPGDSGSPWYTTINGVEKIVAITVSASGCRGAGSGAGGTMGTLIYPYMPMIQPEWAKFQTDLPGLLATAQATGASAVDYSLPLIQRSGGCDAYVQATLQTFKNNKWKDFMPAQGWARVATCPASNPYQPWIRANLPDGTQIRWHIYSLGNWDFFTKPYAYTNTGEANSGVSSSGNVVTTPINQVAPTPTNKQKTTVVPKSMKSITCMKGKLSKVVKGIAPKCPTGYTKKK